MNLQQLSQEIYLAPGPINTIGRAEIDFLKGIVAGSAKGRVRICTHQANEDKLHEMFIAIMPGSYIRPHRHPDKSEAFHIVHGTVDIVIFDAAGGVERVVALSAENKELPFYYRMSDSLFHTLIIKSDLLVVHEITNGPFVAGETVFAPFAPADDQPAEGARFMTALRNSVYQPGAVSP